MSAVALERQFWWRSNLQDRKSFQQPAAIPKPFPCPQLTQTILLPNKIIYCTSSLSPHLHVFTTLPDHKQSNVYLDASSPVCDTRITQKIQEGVYCKVEDASVVPPRMHAQAISCSLAVSMIEDIAAPKKSSSESLYLNTDQSPYTSASSPFTTISRPSSLVTSPTSQCSESSVPATATGANHSTDSLSPSQNNNTWNSKISSKCNSNSRNSLTSKSKAVCCGRRRLIDEEGYIRRAACICVNKEETQAAVWHCLNHYAYLDATFLAERLLAEVDSDEALHLVATSYYCSGKPGRAYSVLRARGTRTPQLRFLMARCCFDLCKLEEAETVLTGGSVLHPKTVDELTVEYGDLACFALQLLGLICARTERLARAVEAFRRSLKLNPFLWQSFVALCDQGDKTDAAKVFRLDGLETFSNCHGNTVLTLVNSAPPPGGGTTTDPMLTTITTSNTTTTALNSVSVNSQQQQQQELVTQTPTLTPMHTTITPNNLLPVAHTPSFPLSTPSPLNTPVAVSITPTPDRGSGVGGETGDGILQAPKKKKLVRIRSVMGGTVSLSPLSPSFGVLPLDTGTPVSEEHPALLNTSVAFLNPSPLSLSQLDSEPNAKIPTPLSKRILCRKTKDSPLVLNKPAVFAPAGNNSNFQSPPSGQPNPNVRRSSRLFGNSNSVKENNKSPARKTKTRSSKSQSSLSELNEKNKNENQDIISPTDKPYPEKPPSPQSLAQQAFAIQKQSAEGLMALLRDMGAAYQQLAQYNCERAIELLSALPTQHYRTGWVLSHIGKAYFEMNDYQQAVKFFSEVREWEPHRLHLMEYYSTALWHQQKEVQLSALAQDLVEEDRECPQAWCATGNCFSLQKEHEAAIRFFSRAIQVDPNFAYAYTLLGHEHIATEELDNALSCYRSAIRIDPRHYNAWYGIGLVLFKQERFAQAESHFRKALSIHPHSSVLMCHVAVVEHALQKSSAALATLNRALAVDPRNPLCKYHRASILHATDRHQQALAELNHLREIVPKESNVYFLLGKVHKKLGQTHLALMNFSWAMDLDPKGANNQFKEAIDPAINRFPVDDDDTTNNNPHNGSEASSLAPAESSQESLILEPQQIPNVESLSDDSL